MQLQQNGKKIDNEENLIVTKHFTLPKLKENLGYKDLPERITSSVREKIK